MVGNIIVWGIAVLIVILCGWSLFFAVYEITEAIEHRAIRRMLREKEMMKRAHKKK